ncbi:MAG TPA: ribonuclease HII [Bacteroidales bacterium]|jgi:ribonuclease HII|nr:ribonuclease HII [Bacteroidales bacterium]HQQ01359.1 ribonuclease HII [Bacteroidales bacterium]
MLQRKYNLELTEAGCDEAGRGSLVGPVFAAAVILPENFQAEGLNDSKKLNPKKREQLKEIIESTAICFSIATATKEEIEKLNILNASILAMHRALDQLSVRPTIILVDGNRFKPYNQIEYACIVKGDGIYESIAAASILAKTYRDSFMNQLHEEYPQYGWNHNKGYATKEHLLAIHEYGLTPYHRRTFKISLQTRLSFK